MNDVAATIPTAIIGALIGIAIGFFSGDHLSNSAWMKEAIQHNCAHYDGQTGDFKWNKGVSK